MRKAKVGSIKNSARETLEHWPLERFVAYARNPRKNDHAVDRLAAAIREFGFRVPMLVKSDGTVVDGHLRLKAAQKLELETVPIMLADDMTEAQIKAFRISVNRMAELAEWDYELLAVELDELRDLDFDLSLIGFEPGELNDLIGTPNTGPDLSEYTSKIEAPTYTPKGDKPEISALFDRTKLDALLVKIEASELPYAEKQFLTAAACRHVVFDYHQIAEFYCHASPEMQRLMEDSALVIIDFEKAIENGFVHVTKRLGELVESEIAEAEDA